MKLIAEQDRFARQGRRFIRWTHRVLLLTGVLALSYVALTVLNARSFQKSASSLLERQVRAEDRPAIAAPPPMVKAADLREGDVVGRIEIQRIGITVAILEGTTAQTLRLGVGHIVGTPLPGEPGNAALAGHRDTWFRDLKEIRSSDVIQIQTATGQSRYQVDWIQIVSPGDTGILTPSHGSSLTLVTCFPFHYIGAAPERFIVHARQLAPVETLVAETGHSPVAAAGKP